LRWFCHTRAPFPFRNGPCPFISSPKNGSIEELHSPSTVYPLQYHLPSLLHPIKGVGSLIIRRRIHSLPSFEFLLRKNSLSSELKSPPPPLLAARSHPSLCHVELRSVRSSESPSSSPSIHDELPCIRTTARSNSNEFLLSQVHRESNASHSLQSLSLLRAVNYRGSVPVSRAFRSLLPSTWAQMTCDDFSHLWLIGTNQEIR
jgi:hypothetical protein